MFVTADLDLYCLGRRSSGTRTDKPTANRRQVPTSHWQVKGTRQQKEARLSPTPEVHGRTHALDTMARHITFRSTADAPVELNADLRSAGEGLETAAELRGDEERFLLTQGTGLRSDVRFSSSKNKLYR